MLKLEDYRKPHADSRVCIRVPYLKDSEAYTPVPPIHHTPKAYTVKGELKNIKKITIKSVEYKRQIERSSGAVGVRLA